MGELEAFYARRRRVTFVICLASALQAILFGSSVLIEGLLTTFDEPPEPGRALRAFCSRRIVYRGWRRPYIPAVTFVVRVL